VTCSRTPSTLKKWNSLSRSNPREVCPRIHDKLTFWMRLGLNIREKSALVLCQGFILFVERFVRVCLSGTRPPEQGNRERRIASNKNMRRFITRRLSLLVMNLLMFLFEAIRSGTERKDEERSRH
jgi:hypothetical protein